MISAAWAQGETAQVTVQTGLLEDLLRAGPAVQLLLLVLIGMSVISWAVMLAKHKQLKTVHHANAVFEAKFWKSSHLQNLFENIDDFPHSTIARLFKSGYIELQKLVDSAKTQETSGELKPRLFGIDNLERALRKSLDTQVGLLEGRLTILATIGSTAPFIGLLGTVIGIMNSFRDIYQAGSASLATVAPGISEALFATAVGLFAAIPAVMAYNHFIGRVRRAEIDMTNFSADFLNIAKRSFFREG